VNLIIWPSLKTRVYIKYTIYILLNNISKYTNKVQLGDINIYIDISSMLTAIAAIRQNKIVRVK